MTTNPRSTPRPSGLRRGVAVFLLALLSTGLGGVAGATASAAVPASQPTVTLRRDHVARTAPNVKAQRIETVAVRRPLTRVRTVLPVLADATDAGGGAWVLVRLPGRPNAHTGWIPAAQTTRASTEWHISVKLSTRRVTVYLGGRVERIFRAVVGKPSTPTPVGTFFIEEAVDVSSARAGGPFALASSARSPVLQEFAGGPGQIALHGTEGLASAPGSAASHGCIRLSTRAITWLARRIGRGVPLTIIR